MDKRISWMEGRIITALKAKSMELKKFLDNEDVRACFAEFLDTQDTLVLYVMQPPGQPLTASTTPPTDFKKKIVYFLKVARQKVEYETMAKLVTFGDLVPSPLESMELVSKELFLHLFSAPGSMASIPEITAKEIQERFMKFVAQTSVTVGLTAGKTLLPIPSIKNSKKMDPKDLVHTLETAVVHWTTQIKGVLAQDAEQLLTPTSHPGPINELEFWKDRSDNLDNLEEQLHQRKVLKCIKLLQNMQSTYYPAFRSLLQDLQQASVEAKEIYRFLYPIKDCFEVIHPEMQSKTDLSEEVNNGLFRRMFHLIYLVWTNSNYYNTPTRLVVLIREICNDLILSTKWHLGIEDLLLIEPEDASKRLARTLSICGSFKNCYFHYKSKAAKALTSNPWRFQNTALFSRLDAYLERCHDLLDLVDTHILFSRLERVEIGGSKGRDLTQDIQTIHDEFLVIFDKFKYVNYDFLDVDDPTFDTEFSKFRETIKDLDRRLGSILTTTFEDGIIIYSTFKVVDSFDDLLSRGIIQNEWLKKQGHVIQAYAEDLLTIQQVINDFKDFPQVYPSMPPTACALIWSRGLMERISEPLSRIETLNKQLLESPLVKETLVLADTLMKTLMVYSQERYEMWASQVGSISVDRLQQNLLRRDPNTQKLYVNFDAQLVTVLREVSYIEKIEALNGEGQQWTIPQQALTLHGYSQTFRSHILALEAIVQTYNGIITNLLQVEKPMVAMELEKINQELEVGLRLLDWNAHDRIEEFIASSMRSVTALDKVLQTLSQGRQDIVKSLEQFRSAHEFFPFTAKGTKTLPQEELSRRYQEHHTAQVEDLMKRGLEIHDTVQQSFQVLNGIKENNEFPLLEQDSTAWVEYTKYVNGIVSKGLLSSIQQVLTSLQNQVDKNWLTKHSGIPLLDIKLQLAQSKAVVPGMPPTFDVKFSPQLDNTDAPTTSKDQMSLQTMVGGWMADYQNLATCIQRVDMNNEHYLADVETSMEIAAVVSTINKLIADHADECRNFSSPFSTFDYLWTQNIIRSFQDFLHPPKRLSDDGEEEENPDVDPLFGIKLSLFEAQVSKYDKIYNEIVELPSSANIGWVRIDAKPIKESIKNVCEKWKASFTGYLQDKVESLLQGLFNFVEEANAGLEAEVSIASKGNLKQVMGYIRDCKRRHKQATQLMEPVNAVMGILKRHHAISEADMERLEEMRKEAPQAWNETYKKSLNRREKLSELQDQEAGKIKDDTSAFEGRVQKFRQQFMQIASFQFGLAIDEAYDNLDQWDYNLRETEEAAHQLRELQELFDLNPSDFKELKDCRSDLKMLKQVWDMIALVDGQFLHWMRTAFKNVDTDFLLEETKKLQKQLKGCSIRMKSWECFKGLETKVKNMATSLPLVQDLRSPSMRDRHWRHLLRVTKQTMQIDPESDSFSLKDLLELGLHAFVEEVANIVEKANKELGIERNLEKIVDIWEHMECTYDKNTALDTYMLGPIDEIVEILEENNNILQGMLFNRFVEYFQEKVNRWQHNLGQVDACIVKWMEVQKQWSNLYPIFMLSEDIKTQLPDDAANFANCDELFRALMDKARHYTNIIELCTTDVIRKAMGRKDSLEQMLLIMEGILEQCEKALADYLETKKKIFPRFYFVSGPDLVDILSKGSDPPSVLVHISKIVDSLDTFVMEGESKTTSQMVSREGEEVSLVREFACVGPVEEWLGGLITVMFDTIKALIADGYATYVENPRTQWIMLYPAQIVCYVTRTWFTLETHQAFDQLEDGNEGALKDYTRQQKSQLDSLIGLVLGELSKGDRKKLVTLITIDIHARDVVSKMVDDKVDSGTAFQWLSQLRYYWDDKKGSVINICDAEFINGYEYIGNCGCLVITQLTDRCYITLAQALKLRKGGAPAGPAGTGKTETTKDLSRALGLACYVFNCSDQMDYKSLGQIFKGLSMSGSWGCFDEFNRIPVEVLSVVATQVKSILDAIKNGKSRFRFMSEEISLITTVGAFITMNPGYKGRAELPENLKALFRPCAMVVPDLMNICEIMLSAEGFIDSKDLSKKFVTLYRLNKQLLSAQEHYDWGLRAVKSVLVIAGELKRGDPAIDERRTLMRALRDTNMAKLSKDDIYVFMKLIQALFPGIDVPVKVYPELDAACKQAASNQGLLPGENNIFTTKCIQYKELLDVRHSVFIMGVAGSGKSSVWKTLAGAFGILGDKTMTEIVNPKAITSDELYGYIHQQTREWKDGLLSRIFRDLALLSKTKKNSKWIVLDGIIDAEWIESMNTVMDDNKMLTLASNERIPLTASMRMVFEISHLRNATPATVSRAGIIYMNETDVGWGPFKDRWVAQRHDAKERNHLDMLFDKYIPAIFEFYKKVMKPIVPMCDISLVQTVCFLLDGLLTEENVPPNSSAELYEKFFVFASIWSFGGPLSSDGRVDYRLSFSNWWKKEFQTIKIAETGSLFDYYIDDHKEFVPWTGLVSKFKYNREMLFSQITVETADTVRLSYMLDLLAKHRRPALFVGTAGTGKTNILKSKLDAMVSANSNLIYRVVNFNSQTDSKSLQSILEQALDKKGGRQYGPPGRKKLIFFIDDINMPTPDKYGTQDAIALLRMHFDYGFWYDRQKMTMKEIVNVQYFSAMNPKAGAFNILDRLQRHYGVFACNMPEKSDLQLIYGQILAGHLSAFPREVQNLREPLTLATIELHHAVSKQFLPTAIKFHYQWNLREMSNIIQGVMLSDPAKHDTLPIVRLWVHECERTFSDRMTDDEDMQGYQDTAVGICRQFFGEVVDVEMALGEPNLWGPFYQSSSGDECGYGQVEGYTKLNKYLNNKLADYNSDFSAMPLVLFNQAMEHVCRISRILNNPRGNALLVGVGGSGKQSLARLSAFICGLDIFQIMVTSTYGINDFRMDVMELYKKCGQKSMQFCFIVTDSQIVDKQMLVYLNDMLASGNIPDLFATDERESIEGSMVNEVKATGHPEYGNKDVCWEFFINKVRNQLHVVLCFSPVGQQFRTWCMQFPALANATVIDWFHPWPQQALVSVAARFLGEIELGGQDMCNNIAEHMSYVHEVVNDVSKLFLESEKRQVYTTPKSFLELISLYKQMLGIKRADLKDRTERLVNGIKKIREASEQVAGLKELLTKEQVVVAEKGAATAELLEYVGKEKVIVGDQNEIAMAEEAKTNKIVAEVDAFAKECAADLAAAKPIVDAALAALDQLDKGSLTELKSMGKPPDDVVMVAAAVMVLTSDPKKIPKDRSWGSAKKMMANVSQWLKELLTFDQNNIPQACVDAVEPMLKNPNFNANAILSKSVAASSLCAWVINMVKYHHIRCDVRPKEERLAEAQEKLVVSKASLKKVQDQVNSLKTKLDALVAQFEDARDEKQRIEDQARKTQEKLNLAERLVNGLADENVRWASTIQELEERANLLIGDVLLASAFISYIGPFSRTFRDDLLNDKWLQDIKARGIPFTQGADPVLNVMTNEAEVAGWNNEGLPADRVSTENGAIVTNCTRWPLMIDPQLQGVKWIKMREEKNGLRIVQPTQKDYLQQLVHCLENGLPFLIEALRESVDPILEPVLARQYIKKGSNKYIKLGDKDILYHDSFRLYLQTKLGNPHYKPEIAAQTTLINFMVTEDGLEDQLLATVVNMERPDLEEQRVGLLRDMNQMKIDLQKCEDGLLFELSNATGDILENVTLIENLENTKKTAKQIGISMGEAKATTVSISNSRKVYTVVAERGSLLFFQIDQLSRIDPMYHFSLEAFEVVFLKALKKAQPAETVEERVENIMKSITDTIFAFVARGLFGRHCLIFSTMLCFAILKKKNELDPEQMAFLLEGPRRFGVERPESILEWCTEQNWGAVQALAEVPGTTPPFEKLPEDITENNRWRMWAETEKPEDEKLPTDWKNLTSFQRLLILRCLRPDRITSALEGFVAESIGRNFVSDQAVPLEVSYEDSTPTTPIFFILSPGVDPVQPVESLGRKLGFREDDNKFFNVSLGQGQESVAEAAMNQCFQHGGWALLNNIHLVVRWLLRLEKIMENYAVIYTKMAQIAKKKAEKRQARRRMRAALEQEQKDKERQERIAKGLPPDEPEEEEEKEDEGEDEELDEEELARRAERKAAREQAAEEKREAARIKAEQEELEDEAEDEADPELQLDGPKGHPEFRTFLASDPSENIPIGILQRSIKLTSEPPQGLRQNFLRAFREFSDEPWENSSKQQEFKGIVFALCFFHASILERKKFGAQGWNRSYPFNSGDLTTCVDVLANNLEDRAKIPWDDLRYVFGEIMYGGHITDDWDRDLCKAYLSYLVSPDVLEGADLCVGFPAPPPLSYKEYIQYIEESTPPETPVLYGVHPNAEINFRTVQGEALFRTINELASASSSGGGTGATEKVRQVLDEIGAVLPEPHNLGEIAERLEDDRSPAQHVFYQECERMNLLVALMRKTLGDLDLGLKGALSMSAQMQVLFDDIVLNKVPEGWQGVGFMSMRPLSSWYQNLLERNQQLLDFAVELQAPKVVGINLFFNPNAFLTAIMQTMAMQHGYDLDQMTLMTEVTKKWPDQVDAAAREGSHVFGMCMEGARWDMPSSSVEDSNMKELYPRMPVMTIRSAPHSKVDYRDLYGCPVYKTQERGAGFVATLHLKTKAIPRKWVIGGVALLLDVVE